MKYLKKKIRIKILIKMKDMKNSNEGEILI